jgi:hypothetical protein
MGIKTYRSRRQAENIFVKIGELEGTARKVAASAAACGATDVEQVQAVSPLSRA